MSSAVRARGFGRHAGTLFLAIALTLAFAPCPIRAQGIPISHEVFAGSELEGYLRALQLAGEVPPYPWSARAFSPAEVERIAPDSLHPWAERFSFRADWPGPMELRWVRPVAGVIVNSAYPAGGGAAVWAGRGLTSYAMGGVFVRAGPVSATIAPVVFRAENAGFDLVPTGADGDGRFAAPVRPNNIDLPQRFGDGAYQRIDPGQSTVRLDLRGVALGVSTANEVWGPARAFPIVMGAEAPGFAHAFVGTSHPLDLWVGEVHARVVWGELGQSEFSPVREGETRRFGAGLAAVFVPRGMDGLELGATRFFHEEWPDEGFGDLLTRPFESLLKKNVGNADARPENQIASAFLRWAPPGSGFEVYGEFAREDHNYDLRDATLEPDHISAYTLGFARVWSRGAERITVLRGEVVNARPSHLARVRGQSPFYVHGQVRQGHTNLGRPLGSEAVYRGWGGTLAVDRYEPSGRWTAAWDAIPAPDPDDVLHTLAVDRTLFRGPLDLRAGLAGSFAVGDGVTPGFNISARIGASVRFQ